VVLSCGASFEHEDRASFGIADDEFVINGIVFQIVIRTANQRRLAGNSSNRRRITIRQPGECRNLRESHSVRHQNLIAFGVVRQRAMLPNIGAGVFGSAARIVRTGAASPDAFSR